MVRFRPGSVVVHKDSHNDGVLATVISGPGPDGAYILDSQKCVRGEELRFIAGGELVEYFSTTQNRWIPAQVLRIGAAPNTFDLDCQEGVGISQLRLSGQNGTTTGFSRSSATASAQATQHTSESACASVNASAQLPTIAELQQGDHCLYFSRSRGWVPATVVRCLQPDGVFDLDVKDHVAAADMHCLQVNELVRYYSSSNDRWIKAKVKSKGKIAGTFDLDCKESVDLRRIRLLRDDPPKVIPATVDSKSSQTPETRIAAGQDAIPNTRVPVTTEGGVQNYGIEAYPSSNRNSALAQGSKNYEHGLISRIFGTGWSRATGGC